MSSSAAFGTRRLVLLALASLCTACADDPGRAGADEARARVGGGPVDIDPVTAEQFAAFLETSRGHVVLVNLWATWCAPCLEEIPALLELETNFAGDGFRLVGISLDDPADGDQIRAFRDEWFPEFRSFHFASTDWGALVQLLDPNWSSVLPTSFVVDRDGNVVETLTGGKDYDSFAAAVTPHL